MLAAIATKGDIRQKITIPTVGIHNVYDALSAFAVGLEYGISPETERSVIRKSTRLPGRTYIIDDLCELSELRNEDCSLLRNFGIFSIKKCLDAPDFWSF